MNDGRGFFIKIRHMRQIAVHTIKVRVNIQQLRTETVRRSEIDKSDPFDAT